MPQRPWTLNQTFLRFLSGFKVVALSNSNLSAPKPVSKSVVEFQKSHFYGKRVPRASGTASFEVI
jgi:hypothetical protein